MAHPEPAYIPLLLRPEMIEEVNRRAAYLRSPEGRAETAEWARRLREDPAEQRMDEELEASLAETPGWEWDGDL